MSIDKIRVIKDTIDGLLTYKERILGRPTMIAVEIARDANCTNFNRVYKQPVKDSKIAGQILSLVLKDLDERIEIHKKEIKSMMQEYIDKE